MTPHEQNIAIARLLPELLIVFKDSIYWTNTVQDVTDREWLYVIHEAEKLLDYDQAEQYASDLWSIVIDAEDHLENPPPSNISRLSATYPQRREALLRTLNLWKD